MTRVLAQRPANFDEPAAGKRSAEVILIPKQLRMEWTDVIMLDPALPPLAKVVAGVIGAHLNRHRGDTYLRQDTIADQLGMKVRAVQTAIGKLEDAGYLVIERRDLGQAARTDKRTGKTVVFQAAGGRGVANTYTPALDGTQVSATQGGKRLAERVEQLMAERTHRRASIKAAKDVSACVHSEGERTHDPQEMDAPACVPTLTDPTDQNPTRARRRVAETAPPHALGSLGDRLLERVGEVEFRSWIAQLAIGEVRLSRAGAELVLLAPTRFVADHVANRFADAILSAFNRLASPKERVARVSVEVKP